MASSGLHSTSLVPDSEGRYPPPSLVPPSLPPSIPPPGTSFDPHMGKDKGRSRIDIILDAPYICLRGTGTTIDPAVLSGHVSLYLSEDTDIREVSLHFRGKAKIPVPNTSDSINHSSRQSYTFCRHDWSFLESSCNSSTTISSGKRSLLLVRTLKAGRHLFPFTFSLTGNLPSTLTLNLNMSAFPTAAYASVKYKLRAVVSRPGLSLGLGPFHNVHFMPMMLHNLTCTMPVYVLRSLSPEALEYQLSLEMEKTWPGKLMYSIMLPHRAWAAGDTLLAVIKLCPLAKGVWVENVITTLWETTELHVQQHHHLKNAVHLPHRDKSRVVHDVTRIVRCVKHKIVKGKAVRVDFINPTSAKSTIGSGAPTCSMLRGSGMDEPSSDARASIDTLAPGPAPSQDDEFENHDLVTYITFPIPHLATGPYSNMQTTPTSASPSVTPDSTASATPRRLPASLPLAFSSYAYSPTPLSVPSGSSTTPPCSSQSSNATINPSHSLPPITVSHRIRWSFSIHNRDGHTSELRCSLPIHILDGRVLSEAREASVLTRRMALVAEGLWRPEDEEDLGFGGGEMGSGELNESGGISADRELPSYMAHLRDRVANMYYPEMATVRVPWVDIAAGGEGTSTENLNRDVNSSIPSPLDWVNSELTLSPSSCFGRRDNAPQATNSPQTHSEVPSHSGSLEDNVGGNSGLSTESGGYRVRNLSSLLKATMMAFTAFSHNHRRGRHGFSKSSLPRDDVEHLSLSGPSSRGSPTSSPTSSSSSTPRAPPLQPPLIAPSIIHRSISEVPDYFVASQGFMGGVPPLSSLMGLPSYEEAAREIHRQRQAADHNVEERL